MKFYHLNIPNNDLHNFKIESYPFLWIENKTSLGKIAINEDDHRLYFFPISNLIESFGWHNYILGNIYHETKGIRIVSTYKTYKQLSRDFILKIILEHPEMVTGNVIPIIKEFLKSSI